jgi:acetaldehyde dehydrogenase
MIMRDTIFCAVGPEVYDEGQDAVSESVHRMVEAVQDYVPGYRLLQDPQFDPPTQATRGQTKVSVFIEVEGAGDFLPPYSGNLDIMTAAATRAGEGMTKA